MRAQGEPQAAVNIAEDVVKLRKQVREKLIEVVNEAGKAEQLRDDAERETRRGGTREDKAAHAAEAERLEKKASDAKQRAYDLRAESRQLREKADTLEGQPKRFLPLPSDKELIRET
jgi:hypothetical protein